VLHQDQADHAQSRQHLHGKDNGQNYIHIYS
jgi:hypothetical protein